MFFLPGSGLGKNSLIRIGSATLPAATSQVTLSTRIPTLTIALVVYFSHQDLLGTPVGLLLGHALGSGIPEGRLVQAAPNLNR